MEGGKIKTLKYYVGCSGWVSSWTDFYPSILKPNGYLAYYSRVFNVVEVDLDKFPIKQKNWMQLRYNVPSSDYGYDIDSGQDYTRANQSSCVMPTRKAVEKWLEDTPTDFRFTLKLPISSTNKTDEIDNFLDRFFPLAKRILAIRVHQTALTLRDGREWLEDLLNIFDYYGYPVALEFDHYSWYQDATYQIMKNHNAALVWTDIIGGRRNYYPTVTADFIYLRINENEGKWIDKVNEGDIALRQKSGKQEGVDSEKLPGIAIIVVDNPPQVNKVLNLLSIPQIKYGPIQWVGRIILCVDLNAFFPSCEELRDPHLVGKPHAVIMTDQKKEHISKGAVASCSYEARRFGIRSAISLSRAKELYPDLILNPVDMPYYKEISDKVMRVLEEYADSLEQSSIDEAYMDCTLKIKSNPSLTVKDYAIQIKKVLREQCGLLTSVGVANTKSVAKIASDFQKPDGLTIVPPDELSKFLENLDVDAISGIGTKTRRVLGEEFRIETIGQLARQDAQKLIKRFGRKHGLWMWQVANGSDSDVVIPREDNISISTEQTIYPHTKNRERLLKYLNELVEEVYNKVNGKGYEFRTVGVKIVRSDFSIETRETSFSSYQNKQESIRNVIEGLLERFSLRYEKNTHTSVNDLAVRKIGIKVSNLFSTQRRKEPEQRTMLDFL